MIYVVKESLDINVHHIVKPVDLCQLVAHGHRVFGTAVRAEPITVPVEPGFAYRFHHLQHALLDHPVNNSRDPQRSHFPIWLRDVYPPHSFRLVVLEFILNTFHQ